MKFFHLTDDLNFLYEGQSSRSLSLYEVSLKCPFVLYLVLESHRTHENDVAGYSEVASKGGTNVMKLEKDLAIANNSEEDNGVMQHNSNVYIRLTFSTYIIVHLVFVGIHEIKKGCMYT